MDYLPELIRRAEDRLAEQRRARAAAAADGEDIEVTAIGVEIGETRRALDALRSRAARWGGRVNSLGPPRL